MNNHNEIPGNSINYIVKYKNVIYFVLKILIAGGLLFFLIHKVNPTDILFAVKHANLVFLLSAFALLWLNLFFQFKKWELTSRNLLNETSKKKIIYSLFAGFSAGAFTPARIGEYFGRAVEFKNKPLLQVTIATFIDKIYPLFIVAFVGAISSILFIDVYYKASLYLMLSLFLLLIVIFYLMAYLLLKPGLLDAFLEKIISDTKKRNSFIETLKLLRNLDRQYSVKMILLSMFFYISYIIQFALLIAAFSEQMHLWDFIWAGTLVMFAKSLIPSISFAELGIREGASIFFLGYMGENSAIAFNAAITLFIINILIPSLAGIYFLFKKNNV